MTLLYMIQTVQCSDDNDDNVVKMEHFPGYVTPKYDIVAMFVLPFFVSVKHCIDDLSMMTPNHQNQSADSICFRTQLLHKGITDKSFKALIIYCFKTFKWDLSWGTGCVRR